MNDSTTRTANIIANKYWSDETDSFDILGLLSAEKLTFLDKKVILFILNIRQNRDFVEMITPDDYTYSSDQETISLFNKELDQYIMIADDRLMRDVERMKFTLAHELGHVFLGHMSQNANNWRCHDGRTPIGIDRFEIQAQKFAHELLVPTDKLTRYLETVNATRTTFAKVAEKFAVSEAVMKMRMQKFFEVQAYE